jgi:hypothetical protein
MTNELLLILEQFFIPPQRLNANTVRPYWIEMVNSFLDALGRVYKRQMLRSTYMRTVEYIYENAIALLSYQWEKLTFTNQIPKMPVTSVDWTFARERLFNSYLVFSNQKFEEVWDMVKRTGKTPVECFQSIEAAYADLPKLPATYLVIMQSLDILAFESYTSYVHTYANVSRGWKVDEWVAIAPPEREQRDEAKIGFGLYGENSTFHNGKFYLKLSGYGKVKDKACAVFDYYCDGSKVRMQEKERFHIQRNGTSYYHGQIWIDLATGDVERGTMLESYIALQEGEKKTPVHIRRKIFCEALNNIS